MHRNATQRTAVEANDRDGLMQDREENETKSIKKRLGP
jgi:hypothetical protein